MRRGSLKGQETIFSDVSNLIKEKCTYFEQMYLHLSKEDRNLLKAINKISFMRLSFESMNESNCVSAAWYLYHAIPDPVTGAYFGMRGPLL